MDDILNPKHPCPICDGEMFHDVDYLEHVQCEEVSRCDHCHLYEYNFSYGHTSVRVFDTLWEWSYDNDDDDLPLNGDSRYVEINKAIEETRNVYRANWLTAESDHSMWEH